MNKWKVIKLGKKIVLILVIGNNIVRDYLIINKKEENWEKWDIFNQYYDKSYEYETPSYEETLSGIGIENNINDIISDTRITNEYNIYSYSSGIGIIWEWENEDNL